MAKINIDNSGDLWNAAVTIADLARNTDGIKDVSSDDLDIYRVEAIMSREWRFEIDRWEFEYGLAYSAWFKDGSAIHISAWATDTDDRDYDWTTM